MAGQENKGRIAAFNFSLGACDTEVAEWFLKQPNKGAYLKSLILADKESGKGSAATPVPTQSERVWDEHFEMLKEFQEVFGRFPAYSETYKGFRLGRWLHDTARRARVSRPDRIEKLQSLGVVGKWERNLALAKRFRDTFGRLPGKYETYQGVNLGAWLAVQTAKLRNERQSFSDEQVKKLLDLGICVSDWEKKCGLLEAFQAEYHRLPKYTETYGDVSIGRWLAHQRKTLDPLKHADRIERFERIGALPYPLPKKQKVKSKA